MSRSPDTVEAGEALRRLDQTLAVAVLAGRLFTLTQAVGVGRAIRRDVRHPLLLRTGLALIVAQSTWAGLRGWRRRTVRDRPIAWSDGAAQVLALLTEASSWGSRALPPDPRWSETFGIVVQAWLPFESVDAVAHRASLAVWLATYLATTSDRSPWRGAGAVRGQRINEGLGQVVYSAIGDLFARQMVNQAVELDDVRAAAVDQAERLASERERQRQHRLIHDSSLQILEAVAGGWDVDDELLLRRIDYEAARLRRLLAPADHDENMTTGSLGDALTELAEEFALLGLSVHVDDGGLPFVGPIPVVEILRDATHEALMNVHKHAGVERVAVRVVPVDPGVEVTIADEGVGFDPAAPRHGFGVSQSIEARLRDAGGHAAVTSVPGIGTRVVLWMPR